MVYPTGKSTIRDDKGGSGYYNAPRTKTVAGKKVKYRHQGVDFVCIPGQDIYMPCTGVIERVARPYVVGLYSGLLIQAKRAAIKMFYVSLDLSLIGHTVIMGAVIGAAQDISEKYGELGVTPHVHLQVENCDPGILYGGR